MNETKCNYARQNLARFGKSLIIWALLDKAQVCFVLESMVVKYDVGSHILLYSIHTILVNGALDTRLWKPYLFFNNATDYDVTSFVSPLVPIFLDIFS